MTSTGEWSYWAVDGDATGGTPIEVTILVALIAVIGPVLAYLAARKNTNAVRLNGLQADATANRAVEQTRDATALLHEREVSRLATERISAAEVMLASSDPKTRNNAYIRLDAVAAMSDLTPDLHLWVAALMKTREPEDALQEARVVKETTGEGAEFYVDTDEYDNDDEAEEV